MEIVFEVFMWAGILLVFGMFMYALFGMAKLSDNIADDYWDEYWNREDKEVSYVIVGDTERFKDCLVAACIGSKEDAEKSLEQLLNSEDAEDKKIVSEYTNLRLKETRREDSWWLD